MYKEMSDECDVSITLALIILYAIIYLVFFSNNLYEGLQDTVPMRAKLDGLIYNVDKTLSKPEQAVEIMAELNQRILKLAKHIKRKYGMSDGYTPHQLATNCPE